MTQNKRWYGRHLAMALVIWAIGFALLGMLGILSEDAAVSLGFIGMVGGAAGWAWRSVIDDITTVPSEHDGRDRTGRAPF